MDNYLCPVVRRLGHGRVDCAWAVKGHGASAVGVEQAVEAPAVLGTGWSFAAVHTTSSTVKTAWKEEIAAQLPQRHGVPGNGSVELQLSFAVGPQRNWVALWKPAIDALGAILGAEDPEHRFSPRDDRVTLLGLHRTIDVSAGHAVRLGIWWRAPNPDHRGPAASREEVS